VSVTGAFDRVLPLVDTPGADRVDGDHCLNRRPSKNVRKTHEVATTEVRRMRRLGPRAMVPGTVNTAAGCVGFASELPSQPAHRGKVAAFRR
jgi:hypothetical protein